ncbi:respiratory nitrate reductase beta subunit [Geothermobacter ehrlichii]|uniref:Respiratory nitrate reductase beta subunit n=1 Tax=Geothermobacter ehrlichii TaxID=213224 RepID=A0A5D3WHZ1_9BACT|nr:nitrate reductase subunit beta [Geothermobacter ehrlichii]TYO96687.1 respiratory nitrate reductase beta subunit [Geothermobacter ehrlichii]
MNIRAQVSSVFHLDKCIGCHTCSIACKNLWTDRQGTEYMWWNNVETKPGTGYPTRWEDQDCYRGGWEKQRDGLRLKLGSRTGLLGKIFHNPHLPGMDDYYEPFTFRYGDLTSAPAGDDQPTARPVSMVSGRPMKIEAGPNWDDDLSGSTIYAANDPGVLRLSAEERQQLFAIEKMVFFHMPRICNHCLNPGCVASCPSGAIYKRGEDGIVLINQDKCRGWRMCVSACPYKKAYYGWTTGKSEKCILCYPRQEAGEAPACFHSCVGRIRYLGVLLYDADRIEATAMKNDGELAAAQREMILDPNDPQVQAEARKAGVPEQVLKAAQKSPVYKFVKEWGIALPLHPEFRTLPMLFYVPPLLPLLSMENQGTQKIAADFFTTLERARLPLQYLAGLFAGGNEDEVKAVYRRLIAVRIQRRNKSVGDLSAEELRKACEIAGLSVEQTEAIYRMTSLTRINERIVVPPMLREQAIEAGMDPEQYRQEMGFGSRRPPKRRW